MIATRGEETKAEAEARLKTIEIRRVGSRESRKDSRRESSQRETGWIWEIR
jgi:hypothetical protein